VGPVTRALVLAWPSLGVFGTIAAWLRAGEGASRRVMDMREGVEEIPKQVLPPD